MFSYRTPAILLLASLGLTATSCISPVQYAPAIDLVDQRGLDAVENDLKNALTTAVAPQVIDVRVDGDRVIYDTTNSAIAVWGAGVYGGRSVINLRAVQKVEVYPNNKLWIYVGNQVRNEFVFSSVLEAQDAADLIMSLREHVRNPSRSQGSGDGGTQGSGDGI